MLCAGDMVLGEGATPMRLVRIADDGVAELILVDVDGRIRRRFHDADKLRSVREMMRPRTCWADTRQVDVIAIEKEERAAAESRRLHRKAARKAKRGDRIRHRFKEAP